MNVADVTPQDQHANLACSKPDCSINRHNTGTPVLISISVIVHIKYCMYIKLQCKNTPQVIRKAGLLQTGDYHIHLYCIPTAFSSQRTRGKDRPQFKGATCPQLTCAALLSSCPAEAALCVDGRALPNPVASLTRRQISAAIIPFSRDTPAMMSLFS